MTSKSLNRSDLFFQNVHISSQGWMEADALSKSNNTNQVFVAMWFDEKMNGAWENGIKPAFENTNFIPLRIDGKEHNNKIDDEIIAEIQQSKFIVADFTGHRGGVYFEAGYAMGRGIPVIWTCKKEGINDLHFDIRQYNMIDWQDEAELARRLHQRIRTIIGN